MEKDQIETEGKYEMTKRENIPFSKTQGSQSGFELDLGLGAKTTLFWCFGN